MGEVGDDIRRALQPDEPESYHRGKLDRSVTFAWRAFFAACALLASGALVDACARGGA